MSKNKTGLFNTGQLSPEKYVRTQVRTLPIEACLITEDWQNTGICNVIIARRHKKGNLTIGLYLVDIYCLGLKDTSYRFGISTDEFDYFKKSGGGMIECDYALAHNIIYGGIAFAGDYEFKPHKDFAVTQFILEEDTEDVELIDIDFGLNGLPCFMRGPYDDNVKVRNIEANLARIAGPGNYKILDVPDDFVFDEEDYLDEGDDAAVALLKEIDKKYDELLRTTDVREMLCNSRIGMDYELTGEAMETEYVRYDSVEEREDYVSLYKMVFESTNMDKVIKKLDGAILKYPGKALFYNLLQSAYLIDDQIDKSDEIVYEMNRLFPGYLFSKVAYANLLIERGRVDEALALFNGKADLNDLYPERQVFHKTEASAFWGTMCLYYITVDNIDAADLYMDALLKYELLDMPNQTIAKSAVANLCELKMDKLEKAGELNAE